MRARQEQLGRPTRERSAEQRREEQDEMAHSSESESLEAPQKLVQDLIIVLLLPVARRTSALPIPTQ